MNNGTRKGGEPETMMSVRSSPKAAQRRAEGAGLDGECAYRAIIRVAAMRTLIGRCPQIRVPVFTSDLD
jgi:hypothetical protein